MSMQEPPHDGVAADAVPALSAPAAPTPPSRVSVAALARTLPLMDMNSSSHGTTAVPCARLSRWPPHCGGLIRTGTTDPTGLAGEKGKIRASPKLRHFPRAPRQGRAHQDRVAPLVRGASCCRLRHRAEVKTIHKSSPSCAG